MRLPLLLLFALAASVTGQIVTPKLGDFPPLRVQAIVGTGRRSVEGSSYQKTMQITSRLVVEGTSKMLPIPAAEATMITVSVDTRAKYVDNKEVYTVASAETVPIPAATAGDRREFNFAAPVLPFDAYRDKSNIGGQVYKFFVCGIRDPGTGTLLFFQTSNVPLESFCKTHPERRAEFLKVKQGANFPSTFK